MEDRQEKEKGKSLLSETRELLRCYDLRARKSLGQHFLVDSGVLRRILAAAEVDKSDVIIEVGPGLGILTQDLAKTAGHIIAVELDDKLAEILKANAKLSGNVSVVNRDILQLDPGTLIEEVVASLPLSIDFTSYKVVANLPYYITSAVLRHFLTAEKKPRLIVVMVQKEVARQITALPGEMSVLAVSVQFYGRPEIVAYVPARSFYPAPEVDSAILKIDVYPSPRLVGVDEDSFFELVRAGFSSARKQIVNSLANRLKVSKLDILGLLSEAGIEPRRRAETLSIEEWGKLWQIYTKRKTHGSTESPRSADP